MDTGLILDINLDAQILEQLLGFKDDLVLCLPGQIRVEVENIVVLHTRCGWQIQLIIPDSLKQTASCQHALAQPQRRQARRNLNINWIGHGDANQNFGSQ